MIGSENNDEIQASLVNLKTWLASRSDVEADETVMVSAPEGLRSIGFADIKLEKLSSQHMDGVVFGYDNTAQKPKPWTELDHLVSWTAEFVNMLKDNKGNFATLEVMRGLHEYPISIAKHHVDESIKVIESVLNFEHALDIEHPDTRNRNYACERILVEDVNSIHDIVTQIFTCLYTKCVVRLVVKTNQYHTSALASYLVDLMHQAGATSSEIKCLGFDKRESIGNEKFYVIPSNKNSKLSTIAVVFRQTDTFAAAQGIVDAYYRDQYPNLIVLVEEYIHEKFVRDWQRYLSHAVQIGARLDEKTNIVESFNSKVQIDLNAIDIKASHKAPGNVINVLKFRTLGELMSLLNNLRKVPYISIWNDDVLLAREFAVRVNQCEEFWFNHTPRCTTSGKFIEEVLRYYKKIVAEDNLQIYNSVQAQFADEVEQLRKLHSVFLKKDSRLRSALLLQSYTSIIAKHKSLKNGSTIGESIARLKRFQLGATSRLTYANAGDSRIETIASPVGTAILLVREESSIKSKAVLLELVFKNLLVGNAVLLVCPVNTLGVRFSFDNDHVIPFKMLHEPLPDISRLSLDETVQAHETSVTKKSCPKNIYAIEVLPEMSSEVCEALIVALGTSRKNIWYSNSDQSNYWS